MPSVFTRIIDRDLPGHFLWRDDICVVFLSINPITTGHALVVPRQETDHWVDLDATTNQHLMAVGHAVGLALRDEFRPARVGLMIAGFEVPHVHVHVLAIDSMADMDFANAATAVDHEELAAVATRLRERLAARGHSEVTDS